MKNYTQEEIDEFINCPKKITELARKQMKLEGSQFRNDLKLCSVDESLEFSVFMRVNNDFNENYSIGLRYMPRDGSGEILLLRCNGPHGPFAEPEWHIKPHIHKAKSDNIGKGLDPIKGGEITDQYLTFDEALEYFMKTCNVTNKEEHFPNSRQLALPLIPETEQN